MKVSPVLIAYTAAGAAGLFVLWRFGKAAPEAVKAVGREVAGIVTGDNVITRNQTNAAGENVTAYEGAGVLGTVGATVNAASGGILASVGQSIGGWLAGVTGADKADDVRRMLKGTPQTKAQALYQAPPTLTGAPVGPVSLVPLSFLNTGGSFKDLASPDGYMSTWTTYGGGLSFDRAPW